MDDLQQEMMIRAVTALELIADSARKMADPTDDELRDRLERSMNMAVFLDTSRGEGEPLN